MQADWTHVSSLLANGAEVLRFDGFFSHICHLCDVWTFSTAVMEAPPPPKPDPGLPRGGPAHAEPVPPACQWANQGRVGRRTSMHQHALAVMEQIPELGREDIRPHSPIVLRDGCALHPQPLLSKSRDSSHLSQ